MTVSSIAALQALASSEGAAVLTEAGKQGLFIWTLGNFAGQADGTNVVNANDVALAEGAWVRQQADSIMFQAVGAQAVRRTMAEKQRDFISLQDFGGKLDGHSDDTAALQAALDSGRAVHVSGRAFIAGRVTVPHGAMVYGDGPQNSNLSFGAEGQLYLSGPGWNMADPPELDERGCLTFADLVISLADGVNSPTIPTILFEKARDIEFSNVWLYHTNVVLDCHRNISFRKVKCLGGVDNAKLVSRCTFQRPNDPLNWISENLVFDDCVFGAFPVDLYDTVSPMFVDCRHFAGPYGIISRIQNAVGDVNGPFLLGPVIRGCTFDSMSGTAIDIEFGGTDCRIVDSFVSAGRDNSAPGIRLFKCIGMDLVAVHVEWCGKNGILLDQCDLTTVGCSTILNQADGDGIQGLASPRTKIVGCQIYNRPLFGGSSEGNTQLAINTPASDCEGWVVVGNHIGNMKGLRQTYVSSSLLPNQGTRQQTIVRFNPGLPYAEEVGFNLINASAGIPVSLAAGWAGYNTDSNKPVFADATGVLRYADGTVM